MTSAVAHAEPLVLADLVPGAALRSAGLVLAGAGLTGIAAQVSFHVGLTPVPITLQTLAVGPGAHEQADHFVALAH